jgi:hypothetical protein
MNTQPVSERLTVMSLLTCSFSIASKAQQGAANSASEECQSGQTRQPNNVVTITPEMRAAHQRARVAKTYANVLLEGGYLSI